MNLEKEKLNIIKWITSLEDDSAIARIKLLKDHPQKTDWWNEISEAEKKSIDKGLKNIKERKIKSHKEVKRLYAKWL